MASLLLFELRVRRCHIMSSPRGDLEAEVVNRKEGWSLHRICVWRPVRFPNIE